MVATIEGFCCIITLRFLLEMILCLLDFSFSPQNTHTHTHLSIAIAIISCSQQCLRSATGCWSRTSVRGAEWHIPISTKPHSRENTSTQKYESCVMEPKIETIIPTTLDILEVGGACYLPLSTALFRYLLHTKRR